MNPYEIFIIALSGALIILLVNNFLTELRTIKLSTTDEIDLLNLLNIHSDGLNSKSEFNATYKPVNNGTLEVTSELIRLNNATRPNPGIQELKCDYNTIMISKGEFKCLSL